jgi:S1-C subfamily serine protease
MDASLGLRKWLAVLAAVATVGHGGASTALAQLPPRLPDQPEAAMAPADLIEKTAQSVVLITVESSRGDKLGIGSGFLIDATGLIATNYHVIKMADKAGVQFRDGTKAAIKGVRATDEKADLAILELDKTPPKAKPLPLGPASPPRPGDSVTAIGHPRGLDFSATKGIVSAIRGSKDFVPATVAIKPEDNRIWIQTDAVIAGGSSGGPLLSDTSGIVPRPGIDGVSALTPTVPLHTNPKRERGLTQVLAAEWEKTLAHASG